MNNILVLPSAANIKQYYEEKMNK